VSTPSHLPLAEYFSLAESYLCVNCHTVCNNAIRCPACAGEGGLLSLQAVLGHVGASTSTPEAVDAQAGGNDAPSCEGAAG
jgi:hypothetical protein